MQAVFVEAQEAAGLLVVHAALADGGFDVAAAACASSVSGVELHVVEHLADGVALDDRLEHHLAVVVQADVHGVGVAEQVVQVAEDLLVGADQERAQVVRLAVERVQRQRALDVAAVDELVDLAVASRR